MNRILFPAAVLVAVLGLWGCARVPLATQAEGLVERARATVETFKQRREEPMDLFRRLLAEAQGVAVFPGVMKVGLMFGAEAGNGVLLARDETGQWGYPAFYTLAAGSFGLQIGGQVSQVVLVVRNRGAVESIIAHQGKLGVDLEVTAGTFGAGVEGATTTNLGADIVVFSQAVGVFGGASLEGGVLAKRNDLNGAFYGGRPTPRAIVLEGAHVNPKADPLRAALVVR